MGFICRGSVGSVFCLLSRPLRWRGLVKPDVAEASQKIQDF